MALSSLSCSPAPHDQEDLPTKIKSLLVSWSAVGTTENPKSGVSAAGVGRVWKEGLHSGRSSSQN